MYSDGSAPEEAPWAPEEHWWRDDRFLFAADLFDHRFYWEAHEAWEAMWHFAADGTPVRDLLQSLIQCAAAALQHHMGRQTGAEHLLERAEARLQPWLDRGHGAIYGVIVEEIIAQTRRHIRGGPWPVLSLEQG